MRRALQEERHGLPQSDPDARLYVTKEVADEDKSMDESGGYPTGSGKSVDVNQVEIGSALKTGIRSALAADQSQPKKKTKKRVSKLCVCVFM
jgi:hypothetical protein